MKIAIVASVVLMLSVATAVAQPVTTQPNLNDMTISNCGSGLPIVGGGSLVIPGCGTRQGNTSKYLSATGTFTSGNCIESDSNGNAIDAGSACGSGAGGGTSQADNSTFTLGTTQFTPAGGTYNTSITNCTSGDACAFQLTIDRMLYVNIGKVNGVAVLAGTGAVGTGAQRVAVGTDTATIAGSAPGTAGSASANVLSVQGVASMTPLLTNPGTAANWGVGATGSAVPANGIYGGAQARSSEITAATNGNLVGVVTDLVGKQIVLPYANPENFVSGVTAAMTGTTSTSTVAAPAAGLRNYLTTVHCYNTHATVSTDILVQDGSAGTTLFRLPAAAVYGGAVIPFPTPLRQPTTATAIFTQNVTTGANTFCSIAGYKGA